MIVFFGGMKKGIVLGVLLVLSVVVVSALVGDVNEDCVVDYRDFVILQANYGNRWDVGSNVSSVDWRGDIDGDGDVDFNDFTYLAANFGKECEKNVTWYVDISGPLPSAGILGSSRCSAFDSATDCGVFVNLNAGGEYRVRSSIIGASNETGVYIDELYLVGPLPSENVLNSSYCFSSYCDRTFWVSESGYYVLKSNLFFL